MLCHSGSQQVEYISQINCNKKAYFFFFLIIRVEPRTCPFQISDLLLSYLLALFKIRLHGLEEKWLNGEMCLHHLHRTRICSQHSKPPVTGPPGDHLTFLWILTQMCTHAHTWTHMHIYTHNIKLYFEVWGYISMVEYLPTMYAALSSILVFQKIK